MTPCLLARAYACTHSPSLLFEPQIADTEAQQEAQIAHYKEVFNQMDWKGDGVLDEQVFSELIKQPTCMCVCVCVYLMPHTLVVLSGATI